MSTSRLEMLNDGGLRHDNRRPYELRSTAFQFNPHSTADGSATAQQGLTTVQATVYGPAEPKQRGQSNHDRANIVVEVGVAGWAQSGGNRRARGDKRLTEIAASIRQTFEPVIVTSLYPRSEISIYIQVLGSDGGILPTAINATTLALIDAGISMLDYVTALSIGLHLTQPLLDLSQPEEANLPYLVLAALPRTGGITLASLETRIHVDRFAEMVPLAVEGCRVLKAEMDGVVKARTERLAERIRIGVIAGADGAGKQAKGVYDDDDEMM